MSYQGLIFCARFAYPPNSYSLCGPARQTDLQSYVSVDTADQGTVEILSEFTTLYPYLRLIAQANRIQDPFDHRVVEAYWIGNHLLSAVPLSDFANHLTDTLDLKKKLSRPILVKLLDKLPQGAIPHHAFHVINIWRRTGHLDIVQTLQSAEACLVSWGQVKTKIRTSLVIEIRPLKVKDGRLMFGQKRERVIKILENLNKMSDTISKGDWIAYHWGYFCSKLDADQLKRLIFYTQKALDLFNTNLNYEEKDNLYIW